MVTLNVRIQVESREVSILAKKVPEIMPDETEIISRLLSTMSIHHAARIRVASS